jgi:hypothetical protein
MELCALGCTSEAQNLKSDGKLSRTQQRFDKFPCLKIDSRSIEKNLIDLNL